MMNRVEVLVVGTTNQIIPEVLPALRLRSDVAADVEQAVELGLRHHYDLILISQEVSQDELIRAQELFARLRPEAKIIVTDLDNAESVRKILLSDGKDCVRQGASKYEIKDNPLSALDEISSCQIQ